MLPRFRPCRSLRGRKPIPAPVRIVVGFAAGGTGDVLTRLIGQWLSERLGQPIIIDNRPGGAGNIGTEAVVRAPPDGYTLLQVGTSHAVNATLFDLDFDVIRDIAPVAGIARAHLVMLVHPSFPAKTVPDSSPMPKPIRARSIWRRRAAEARRGLPASCSSS